VFRHPFFALYGIALAALAGLAEYRGWTFSRVTEIRGVPKTIRDNPGIYRSIYSGYPRYSGGK
jgi:hypothetical protein